MNSFKEILITLFITVISGVLVAWIIREGIFQSSKEIAISVTNNDCSYNDFYVDGEQKISSMPPSTIRAIKANSGEHLVQYCLSNEPTNCQAPIKVTWSRISEYAIPKSSLCPVEATMAHNGCYPQDIYVDGVLTISDFQPGDSKKFEIVLGPHTIKACVPGTDDCMETTLDVVSQQLNLYVNPSCP